MNTREVAEHFGSKKKLAVALGIHPSAVTMWGNDPRVPPVPDSGPFQGKFKAERKSDAP
ncbi:Cro/CI family transcriptional regulator [Pseudomonas sp. H22_DOA]|nr:Cro/CI family transcriptional regulator [Pseudomonas sp. H22_DOA]